MTLRSCKSRLRCALLCLLLLVVALPRVHAAENIDPLQPVSLTVTFRSQDTALAGLPFDLYLVGTMDPYGELTVTEDFALFNIDIRGRNDEAWRSLSLTLEGYVAQSGIAPIDSAVTDENGQVRFPAQIEALPQGLYFIPGFRYVQDEYIYEAEPFMALLPCEVDGQRIYDLSMQPKYSQPEDKPMIARVIKVWNDDGNTEARPQEITVQLLCNGEVYDTVTLNDQNNWRFLWTNLSSHYRWTVVEQVPEGYTVEIVREGNTFVVTNTGDKPETPPGLPQTGQLWWPVPLLAAAGLALTIAGLLRRKGADHET